MSTTHSKKRIAVVGSGFSGLAVAALLSKDGHEVTVLEKNALPGGRAQVYEKDGFRWDVGPSWYLMPDVFEQFFQEFDKRPGDYYQLKRLDPSYRIFFGPDDWVDLSSDLQSNMDLFESHEPGAAKKLREYIDIAQYQYEAAVGEFLYKDYRTIFDFFTRRTMTEGRKLHVFENIDTYARRFFKSDRLRKVMEYSMVFLGGSPSNTPAMYSLLSHVDFNLGVWYPMGGIGSVVTALQELAESCGARFCFGQEVLEVNVRNGRAESVRTVDGEIPADIVVMNADYAHCEINLLEPKYQTYRSGYWEKRVLAPSAFMMYLGLDKPVTNLLHHTLSFEHDWMHHFNAIFDAPAWPEEPSYYICCPTKTDAALAPDGCENLVVLVPVAAGLEDDDSTRDYYAQKTIYALERLLGQPLGSSVVSKTVFSQRDFSKIFNAYKGTALSLSHTLMQTAVFRPSHRSRKVKNLYYTGQYTHPGIGLPMALISAKVVNGIISREQGRSG